MVCVPCFIVPLMLYIWHRFIQPYVLRYWNPWTQKDKDGKVVPDAHAKAPFDCTGGKCIFMGKKKEVDQPKANPAVTTDPDTAVKADADKKQE